MQGKERERRVVGRGRGELVYELVYERGKWDGSGSRMMQKHG